MDDEHSTVKERPMAQTEEAQYGNDPPVTIPKRDSAIRRHREYDDYDRWLHALTFGS